MISDDEWSAIKVLLTEQIKLSKSNKDDDSVCDKLDVYWYRMTDKEKKQFERIVKKAANEHNNSGIQRY